MAVSLLSKFRGCLIGSHVGDCVGAPFEFDQPVSRSVLINYMKGLLKEDERNPQILPYTDDTAMTSSIAKSLVEKRTFDPVDISKRFVEEYFSNPRRCYGKHVVDVFKALAESNFKDVFEPAKHQFRGNGSYGNGAAMRIAPIAMYCYDKSSEILEIVKQSALITHTHQHGYNGAIVQCLAIEQALKANPEQPIDPVEFVSNLLDKVEKIEDAVPNPRAFQDDKPYCIRLKKIKDMFNNELKHMSPEQLADSLGNNVSAHKSVPTAIYSFLKGLQPLADFETENPFVRTLYISVSMGGDTDTIAAMAGSIAGAYYGAEVIPESFQARCESLSETKRLADDLYALCCGG